MRDKHNVRMVSEAIQTQKKATSLCCVAPLYCLRSNCPIIRYASQHPLQRSFNNTRHGRKREGMIDTATTSVVDYLVSLGWNYKITNRDAEKYKGPCPVGHHAGDDVDPKFSVHANGVAFCCFKCGFSGGGLRNLKQQMGLDYEPRVQMPNPNRKASKKKYTGLQGATVRQLCDAKGIDYEYAKSTLEWKDTTFGRGKSPAVEMPYRDIDGQYLAPRFRVGISDGTRILSSKGSRSMPYGLQNISQCRAGNYVICEEGETDWATLDEMGYNALGIPGVNTFKAEWTVYLNGIKTVYVWQESGGTPDRHGRTPGQQMVHRISEYRGEVFVLEAPAEGKDPCELRQKLGDDAFAVLLDQMMVDAKPYNAVALEAAVRRANNPKPATDVAFKVRGNNSYTLNATFTRGRGREAPGWLDVCQMFPVPSGVKPWTHSTMMWSDSDSHGIAIDVLSNTWKNAANAQFKRQKIYFNLWRRVEDCPLYMLSIPLDDWGKQKHQSIKRKLQRHTKGTMEGWAWFDNIKRHGTVIYITSVPGIDDFSEVPDNKTILMSALNGIVPPSADAADTGRFRPFGGSHNWTAKAETTGEVDKGRYETVAVAATPTEFNLLEVMCDKDNIPTINKAPVWRGQQGSGLAMCYPDKAAFVAAIYGLSDQYTLTKKGVAALVVEV